MNFEGMTGEEIEKTLDFLDKEHQEAVKSYVGHEGEERCCCLCGRLMKYNSMAWFEGFHFDSCI